MRVIVPDEKQLQRAATQASVLPAPATAAPSTAATVASLGRAVSGAGLVSAARLPLGPANTESQNAPARPSQSSRLLASEPIENAAAVAAAFGEETSITARASASAAGTAHASVPPARSEALSAAAASSGRCDSSSTGATDTAATRAAFAALAARRPELRSYLGSVSAGRGIQLPNRPPEQVAASAGNAPSAGASAAAAAVVAPSSSSHLNRISSCSGNSSTSSSSNRVSSSTLAAAAVATTAAAVQDAIAAKQQFEAQLGVKGWKLLPQAGDGNCLFRAVSVQLYGDPDMHLDIRKKCLDFMCNDRAHFSPYITEDFDAYIARKKRDGVHGNNPEIQAISELFNRPIEVFVPERGVTPINIFHGGYQADNAPIRLLYSGQSHYDAIVDPSEATVGQGLGLPGLSPEAANTETLQANMLASDVEATEQELEQAAITASLQSYAKDAWRQKKRRRTDAHSGGGSSSGSSANNSGNTSPLNSHNSSSACGSSSGSSGISSSSLKAPLKGGAGSDLGKSVPSNRAAHSSLAVQEMLMNGFPLERVQQAFELVGDSVDDLLAVLMQQQP